MRQDKASFDEAGTADRADQKQSFESAKTHLCTPPHKIETRGRKRIDVDMDAALDLIMRGEKVPAISRELGISPPTLRARIADISKKQGLLLKYRSVQSLQLTELQARILEAITPEKIEEASLRDLIQSYKILKDKEQVIEGQPSEIKGLISHLIHLEKQDEALKDAKYTDKVAPENPENPENPETQRSDLIKNLELIDDTEF